MTDAAQIELDFEEKQYLGFNAYSALRRITLAIFCFLAYFFAEDETQLIKVLPKSNTEYFFYLGIFILLISAGLMFILHIHTTVHNSSVTLTGFWTARKVKINLSTIQSAKLIEVSKAGLSRPVYNLHFKGRIKFYTRGSEAVQLTDYDGTKYIIGSQKAGELLKVIQQKLKD